MPPGLKVAIVNSLCVQHDAISSSIAETAHALEADAGARVTLFSYLCGVPGLDAVTVNGVGPLLTHPRFLEADVLLFHFGIYYDLFDALILGNGRARRLARYHNVTPRELVPERMHKVIEQSMAQIENLAWADHVWCDSEYNRRCLLDYGLPSDRVSTLALPVEVPTAPPPARAVRGAPVVFAYVGRLVPAKGVHDLVHAALALRARGVDGFRVMLAGNADFSDAEFTANLAEEVRLAGATDYVTFCGQVGDAEKARMFEAAHALVMPSYHEGFCMPVVEALGRGCFVIGYAAGNTPFITHGFGNLVPAGDVEGLAACMERFVRAVQAEDDPAIPTDGHGVLRASEFRARAHSYASGFAPPRFRERLVAAFAQQLAH